MTRTSRAGIALVALSGLAIFAVISLSHVRAVDKDVPAAEEAVTDSPTSVPNVSENKAVADAPAKPKETLEANEGSLAAATVIAEIESLGGRVTRDESRPGRPVYEIVLSDKTEFTDADLERLEVFDNLQVLVLGQIEVTEPKLTRSTVPTLATCI